MSDAASHSCMWCLWPMFSYICSKACRNILNLYFSWAVVPKFSIHNCRKKLWTRNITHLAVVSREKKMLAVISRQEIVLFSGNGMDCHLTRESVLFGSIVMVQNLTGLWPLFKQGPFFCEKWPDKEHYIGLTTSTCQKRPWIGYSRIKGLKIERLKSVPEWTLLGWKLWIFWNEKQAGWW